MSYSNSVTLNILKGDPFLIQDLREENDEFEYLIDDEGRVRQSGNAYKVDDDLKAFSAKHPETLFELTLEHEDPESSYRLYAQAGKTQTCPVSMTYAPFDENKLK